MSPDVPYSQGRQSAVKSFASRRAATFTIPPRTHSGRAEMLEAQEFLKPGRTNVAGLAAVPTEILVNVISHFSCIPIPYMASGFFGHQFPPQFLERLEALQTLSQTCRRLHSVVFPILWEKIEVAARRHSDNDQGFEKRLATELVRQLEIVTVRDPTLAPRVQEVSICLSDYSLVTILPELVKALHMFPKMRALQIFGLSFSVYNAITNAFSGHIFPSVNLLAMTQPITSPLAKSFPQVKSYYSHNYHSNFSHWSAIKEHWKVVTEVHGLAAPDKATLMSIATKLPNLSYLEIRAETNGILRPNGFLDMVPFLQLFKNLQVIKLIVRNYATDEQRATAKANIASVLTKLQSTSSQKRCVIIGYCGGVGSVPELVEERFESSNAGAVVSL